MDWLHKSWDEEDAAYAPKRQVHNRASWLHPHEIGSFPSFKNGGREVAYESGNERLFYYLLELDPKTVRYYPQPLEISMSGRDKSGLLKTWPHYPDVLVFRQGNVPILFEIKESPGKLPEGFERTKARCMRFAEDHGWRYTVIYPKQMPSDIIYNLNFLITYLKKRIGFDKWIPEVLDRLNYMHPCAIDELSETFRATVNPLFIKPVIYHLIAKGNLSVDVNRKINQFSEVSIASAPESLIDQLKQWFVGEEHIIVLD